MNTHLSQPIGIGAFDGQHGMSLAISPVMAGADIFAPDISPAIASSAIADIDASAIGVLVSDIAPAILGRDSGASTSPAIIKITSSRRMVIWRVTPQNPTERPGLIVRPD